MKIAPIRAALASAALFLSPLALAQHPGGHHGDIATLAAANPLIEADQSALDNAFTQLRSDVRSGNTAAVAGDEAAIMTALTKLQQDRAALRTAVQSNTAVQAARAVVEADAMAIERDRTQLRADEIAGNRSAIAADEHTLSADETKLRADLRALRTAIAGVTF